MVAGNLHYLPGNFTAGEATDFFDILWALASPVARDAGIFFPSVQEAE